MVEGHSTAYDGDGEFSNWKCVICGKVFENGYILNYPVLLEHSKYKRPPTGVS
jgi:hypothetical protein